VPTLCCPREGNTLDRVIGEQSSGTAESENLCMSENSKRENREILFVFTWKGGTVRKRFRRQC
jgi:hypothetical protein